MRRVLSCIVVLVSVVLLTLPSKAGPGQPRRPEWAALYRGPNAGLDQPHAIGVSPDGRIVFVGGVHHVVGGFDQVTIAYDAGSGRKIWSAVHGGRIPRRVIALAVSPLGDRVFVTGTIYHPRSSGLDFLTVAYSARTGKRLWTREYEGRGPVAGEDEPAAIMADPSGRRVYVVGTSLEDGVESFTAIAYGAGTGHTEWISHLSRDPGNGSSHEPYASATSAALSPTQRVLYVTGFTTDAFVIHGTTIALRTGTGGTKWIADDTVPGSYFWPSAVSMSLDGGRIYVSGPGGGTNGVPFEAVTVAHAAEDGSVIWTRAQRDMYWPVVSAVTPFGGRIVVASGGSGYDDRSGASLEHWVVACYRPRDGRRLWERFFGSQAGIASEFPYAVAASPLEPRIYVVGSIASRSRHDWWGIAAYRVTDGRRLWWGRIVGPWRGSGADRDAVAVSAWGRHVVITGASAEEASDGPGLDLNFLTAAYQG